MAVRGSTRHVVASTSINTTIFTGKVSLNAASQSSVIIEIDLSTSDNYNDLASAVPPAGAAGNFRSSMGHLLEIWGYPSSGTMNEIRVDFAPNGDGAFTPLWRNSIVIGLAAGPSGPNLIRIPTSFARVTWVNNDGANPSSIESEVKVLSL